MIRYLIILFLLNSLCLAQEHKTDSSNISKFSIGLTTGLDGFSKNSFLSKSYKNFRSTKLDMTYPISNVYGFGFLLEFKTPEIISTAYVGNTKNVFITEIGAFATYKKQFNPRLYFLGMLGISNFNLKNTIRGNYRYRSTGTKVFAYPELGFKLKPWLSLTAQGNIGYIGFYINASDKLDTNYKNVFNYGAKLGLRFHY